LCAVTSFRMNSLQASAASQFNHSWTASFTSSSLLTRLHPKIPSTLGTSKSTWCQAWTTCRMLKNFPPKRLKRLSNVNWTVHHCNS